MKIKSLVILFTLFASVLCSCNKNRTEEKWAEEEARLAYALSQIEGAGRVVVVLSLRTSLEQEIAVNEDANGRRETVTLSRGGGVQSEVTLRYHYPEFQGALIVSQGANDPSVQLRLTQAVSALTGLRTDRITISPMAIG